MKGSLSHYAAHAGAGCVSAVAGGGKCGQGAASALVGKFVTLNTEGIGGAGISGDIARGVAASVGGGLASAAGGGKFSSGAETAAFGYMFNYCSSVGCFRETQAKVANFFASFGDSKNHTMTVSSALAASGHLGFFGASYSEGASVDTNGQVCLSQSACIRVGLGIYGAVGAQGGFSVKSGTSLTQSNDVSFYLGGGADASSGIKGIGGQALVGTDRSLNLITGVPGAGAGAGVSGGWMLASPESEVVQIKLEE